MVGLLQSEHGSAPVLPLPPRGFSSRKQCDGPSAPAPSPSAAELIAWLEKVRPGAHEFATAFQKAGFSHVREFTRSPKALARLKSELTEAGAKILRVKQLTDAVQRVAGSQQPEASPGSFKGLESPSAVYFGESCRHAMGNTNNANSRGLPPVLPDIRRCNINTSSTGTTVNRLAGQSPMMTAVFEEEYSGPVSKNAAVLAQSPMESYFNGQPGISFCLDNTPVETPIIGTPGPSPMLFASVAPSYGFSSPWMLQQAPPQQPNPLRPLSPPWLDMSATGAKPSVMGHVWSLSQDAAGSREVQEAIEAAESEAAKLRLAMELSGHVREALQCPHANHVVRKVINTLTPTSLQFIVDELLRDGASAVGEAARHRYGCRIVEALMKTCSWDQLQGLVALLLPDVLPLSVHMYGNFVVQRLLEFGTEAQRHHIMEVLCAQPATVFSNFYGAVVAGAALKHASRADCEMLCRAVISVDGLLMAIMRFRHGRVVKDQLLQVLPEADHVVFHQQLSTQAMKAPRNAQPLIEGAQASMRNSSGQGGRSSRKGGAAAAQF